MRTLYSNRKTKIFIFHGAYGHPDENWFGWMKQELQERGILCEVPSFPTPEGQSLQSWLAVFSEVAQSIDSSTILIGHSLGAAFLLRWLERNPVRIKAAILVGAFIGEVGVSLFDSINRDFFSEPYNWERLRNRSSQFICYHGSNDPYVSKENFELLAGHLRAKKRLVLQGGHFNVAAGYRRFPLLLTHLNQLLEQN